MERNEIEKAYLIANSNFISNRFIGLCTGFCILITVSFVLTFGFLKRDWNLSLLFLALLATPSWYYYGIKPKAELNAIKGFLERAGYVVAVKKLSWFSGEASDNLEVLCGSCDELVNSREFTNSLLQRDKHGKFHKVRSMPDEAYLTAPLGRVTSLYIEMTS